MSLIPASYIEKSWRKAMGAVTWTVIPCEKPGLGARAHAMAATTMICFMIEPPLKPQAFAARAGLSFRA